MIYLDNCATTRVDDDISEKVLECMKTEYGNPSSLHHFGMDAYQIMGSARADVGNMIGAAPENILFTSSGSEANNIAIHALAYTYRDKGKKIVTTAIEHSSILTPLRRLEQEGFEVVYVMPRDGRMRTEDIVDAVDEDTIFVSVMHANNETGEILDIPAIVQGCKEKNPDVLIHCDCVQSYGKIPVELYKMKVDLLSASGHKIHAPKGIGILYVRPGLHLDHPFFGGSQEKGFRPGTENVPAIAGFGMATVKAMNHLKKDLIYVQELNTHLRNRFKEQIPEAVINSPEDGLPYLLSVSFPGHSSHDLINELSKYDIYVSAGAACNKDTLSHVLQAYGLRDELVRSVLRISFSHYTTIEELDTLVQTLCILTRRYGE